MVDVDVLDDVGVGIYWISGSDDPCVGRTEDRTLCTRDSSS